MHEVGRVGDTWITDMQHFTAVLDPSADLPGPARHLGEYLGRIVQAATAWYVDQPLPSLIQCRRRPGRQRCPGRVHLVRTEKEEILWECESCGDNGVIRGWKGTPWDLSEPEEVAEFVAVIPAEVYAAVAQISDLPRPALRVIVAAAVEREGALLTGTLAQLDALTSAVEAAVRKNRGGRRTLLEQLLAKLAEARAEPKDDEDAPAPSDKISDTLLSFAAPLLDVLGSELPVPMVEKVLMLAVTVWNALVLEAWGRGDNYLDQARQRIAGGLPQFMPMFEMLVERKKRFFGADLRAIGEVKVSRKPDGELQVVAEARMPETLLTIH